MCDICAAFDQGSNPDNSGAMSWQNCAAHVQAISKGGIDDQENSRNSNA